MLTISPMFAFSKSYIRHLTGHEIIFTFCFIVEYKPIGFFFQNAA